MEKIFLKQSQKKINILNNIFKKKFSLKLKEFSQINPKAKHITLSNYINGKWKNTAKYEEFPDPAQGHNYLKVPLTEKGEMSEIVSAMKSCPKHGLHNPLKNVNRYIKYGDVCRRVTEALHNKEIFDHFVKLIQRTFPKSDAQAVGELIVTRAFFENFCGDNVRFLARGFSNPGDHDGQQSQGYRWPYGSVCIIAPFNFPLVIICLFISI